jgi:hypothetical protein
MGYVCLYKGIGIYGWSYECDDGIPFIDLNNLQRIFLTILFCLSGSVTKTYFENLVRALENGLEDVNNSKGTSKAGSSSRSAGSSKGRSGKVKSGSSKVRAADDHHHHWPWIFLTGWVNVCICSKLVSAGCFDPAWGAWLGFIAPQSHHFTSFVPDSCTQARSLCRIFSSLWS